MVTQSQHCGRTSAVHAVYTISGAYQVKVVDLENAHLHLQRRPL